MDNWHGGLNAASEEGALAMGPFIFAIFVICTPDLLSCNHIPHLEKNFYTNVTECRKYVTTMETYTNNNVSIVMGTCVWRIVND